MNDSLIETCKKVEPDVLVLGHAQLVFHETIARIKEMLPEMKVIQWFVDPLVYSKVYDFILNRIDLLDAVFFTTGGDLLELFRSEGCQAHFFPNVVHKEIEKYRAFEAEKMEYDLIFVGNDRKDPERRMLLQELDAVLSKKFKVGIFGSLGRPGIHGSARDLLFRSAKASLNLTRHHPIKWYSSDRISQLMGNGILSCTRAEADLHEVYGEDALLTYRSTEELIEKLERVLSSGEWKEMARKGWEKVHQEHSAKSVSQKMLEVL